MDLTRLALANEVTNLGLGGLDLTDEELEALGFNPVFGVPDDRALRGVVAKIIMDNTGEQRRVEKTGG